ncbi:flagellar hook-associated protein FlgL [Phosphitispora sp. TUW77]|uniref:flagellar hook-associated protein FlgL n=1 Tax=Phosphitispora sp. TUW77 TaxID=3152361 RepID=UPI003AB70286
MRVTQGMLAGNFLNNLNANYRNMNRIQEQLSTGKKINRPSDDPIGVATSLRLYTGLTETEKYKSNVDAATAWLDTTDTALGQAGDVLNRVRELTIAGASDSLSQSARYALAAEISQLREQVEQIGNTAHDGRYIFSGFRTTEPAFEAGIYEGDSGSMNYEIGVNITMPINITGDDVFINTVDVFALLTNIETEITAGDTPTLSGTRLEELDQAIDNILSLRSEVGAKTNRLELTNSRLEDAILNFSSLLSENEDINTAEVITQLKMQENTYNTALAAGARIIQPTLLDFLR